VCKHACEGVCKRAFVSVSEQVSHILQNVVQFLDGRTRINNLKYLVADRCYGYCAC
jgi:hypothetical protein